MQAIDPKSTLIGVVGAGNMGSGIAQKYATEGFEVVVLDINEDAVARGKKSVETTLNEGVERKIFKPEKRDAILSRMSFTTDKSKLKSADLIVEAIFENKKVKQELFAELDGLCEDKTLLSTNTSSFFVDDVAETTKQKERVLGLHYFYHPAKNRLVEVIKGSKTSDAAFQKAWRIQELTGKIPVDSKDAPGFIVNRYFVPWLNESMRLVEEGAANIATVEWAAKKAFGAGMGPFQLMNVTGVPITLHAATTLGEQLGPFYAPCDLIRPVVEKKENWSLDGDVDESKYELIFERLWGVIAQIATTIVFDEKVCTLEDCDLGARVGLRWPVGPFEAMNDMGTDVALAAVQKVAERYEDLKVPAALIEHGSAQKEFAMRQVTTRIDEGVGFLTLNRPDAMNALNETVVAQLHEAFTSLDNDDAVKGIVIEGRGKAFVAGADTRFFVDQIKGDNVPRIVKFAADGQKVFRAIDLCSKTVVCKVDGLSLGGGTELALSCDYIVATPNGSCGFPETGIGIYPGLGGTQRTARRVGIPLARWLVLTGQILGAKKAQALGMFDEVVAPAEIDAACKRFALSEKPKEENAVPSEAKVGFEAMWSAFSGTLEEIKTRVSDDESVQKAVKKIGHKAPRAVDAADTLLLGAKDMSLEEGLAAETAALEAIFRTEDALEGLSSIGKRRPAFKNA